MLAQENVLLGAGAADQQRKPGGSMGSRDKNLTKLQGLTFGERPELPIVETVRSTEQLRDVLTRERKLSMLKVGTRLVDLGLITDEQLKAALHIQTTHVARHLGHILVDFGYVSDAQLRQVLCEQLGIPLIRVEDFRLDDAVLRLIPEDLMRECRAAPLCSVEGRLVVALEDPLDSSRLERVRFAVQVPMTPVMALREDIDEAIRRHYGAASDMPYAASVATRLSREPRKALFERERVAGNQLESAALQLVKKTLLDAKACGASDIHLDGGSAGGQLAVRFRQHGRLTEYLQVPAHLQRGVLTLVKNMAGLDSARTRPQEGRIKALENGPAGVQLRVIALPTAEGSEHIAINLVSGPELIPLSLLGLPDAELERVKQLFTEAPGMMLISGVGGSGKTTTAYALLNLLKSADTKVWTVERPVELRRHGWSQVEVDTAEGLEYASVLRRVMRADPDAILIGDVQDRDTAGLGIEAALRGRRVAAVLHARGAVDAAFRLIELGVNAFSLSDAMSGVVSQRLARRLCLACRNGRPLTGSELDMLLDEYRHATPLAPAQVRADWAARYGSHPSLYSAAGCETCAGTGYDGHIAIFEILSGSPEIRRLIRQRRPVEEVAAAAMQRGMRTLRQDGLEKALAGYCDIAEVRAATV
jgi:type II secretory ATPase GspE/PulE/Tfp pilus assembly ATPase PilB-like protein